MAVASDQRARGMAGRWRYLRSAVSTSGQSRRWHVPTGGPGIFIAQRQSPHHVLQGGRLTSPDGESDAAAA